MRLFPIIILLLLLPTSAAWAQAEPVETEPGMGAPLSSPRMPRNDVPRLPSERNERFAPRLRPGQTDSAQSNRSPVFERRDPRAIRYGEVDTRRSAIDRRSEGSERVDSDLNRAVEQVQAQHGGKILSADRMRHRGQDVYRVKVLTPDGRVKTVQLEQPESPNHSEEQR
ncbi:MAG: PepSY domain-containing protein [Ahniella sp.]|nr:PepSY domain-containing protein [Ahniella sp.]